MERIYKANGAGDIEIIVGLAFIIWTEHYAPIIGDEQVAYMLERFQSAEAVRRQINDEQYEYYIAETREPAGYCALRPEPDKRALFLSKLYVKQEYRRQGLARRLMDYALKDPRPGVFDTVRLTVNKHNNDSIEAYERMGFIIQDSVVTDIGNGFVMDDYVMEKST